LVRGAIWENKEKTGEQILKECGEGVQSEKNHNMKIKKKRKLTKKR